MEAAMTSVIALLNGQAVLEPLWRVIIVLFFLYLGGLPVVILLNRRAALIFLGGFAATPALNALECLLRFVLGLAFMALSPETLFPQIVFVFGAFLCISALVLLSLGEAHRKFAAIVGRHMPRFVYVYALLSLALLGGLIYVFAPVFR